MIYQALLWNDAAEDPPKKVGTLIILSYRHKKLDMQKINWGAEEDFKRSRDGRVEMNWDLDEANTQKLMTLMKARSGKELIYKMYRRFRKDKYVADFAISHFFVENDIKVDYYVYY